jgi:phage replication O-like protein O
MTIQPPNYTQVPNAIFDRMHEMTPAEFMVLSAICRKTFGWQKSEDVISLSQLQKMTGLSRTAVQDGIMAGMDRGMLERRQVGSQSFSYHLLVASDYQSTQTTSSGNGPVPVASDYQELVASDYSQKKDLKKLKENVDRARARAEPPPPTILELTENHDAGDADFDPVEALIEIDFTPAQAVDAQAAYREADRPLDVAEVARIAQYIAEPPAHIQRPCGYLASQWRLGKVPPLVAVPVKRGPAWDKDTQRFEPQPASLPPEVLQERDRLQAEIESTRGQLDPRVVDARAAIARVKLRDMPAVNPANYWRTT